MLIIFDLDDTLIDTSGCLTPIRLKNALTQMIKAGLEVPNFDKTLKIIEELNATSESARTALIRFIELQNADKKFLDIGLWEIYENVNIEFPLVSYEGVIATLLRLKQTHQLALVSFGKEELQFEKMKKAGIDSALFSKVVISKDRDKKPHYKSIAEKYRSNFEPVVVVGDRVKNDLIPAKELGFKTVQMCQGRALCTPSSMQDVDYVILRFPEIIKIISEISCQEV